MLHKSLAEISADIKKTDGQAKIIKLIGTLAEVVDKRGPYCTHLYETQKVNFKHIS